MLALRTSAVAGRFLFARVGAHAGGFAVFGSAGAGNPGCAQVLSASRRTPSRKSLPSERQFFAMAENCSRCHLMVTREPISKERLTRTHAPECDVSSIVAATRLRVPLASSQKTSATAHITVLGSNSRTSMSSVSAEGRTSLVALRQPDADLKLGARDVRNLTCVRRTGASGR